jgi:hypothetical protein
VTGTIEKFSLLGRYLYATAMRKNVSKWQLRNTYIYRYFAVQLYTLCEKKVSKLLLPNAVRALRRPCARARTHSDRNSDDDEKVAAFMGGTREEPNAKGVAKDDSDSSDEDLDSPRTIRQTPESSSAGPVTGGVTGEGGGPGGTGGGGGGGAGGAEQDFNPTEDGRFFSWIDTLAVCVGCS